MKLGPRIGRTHQLALCWLAAACAGLGCSLALKFDECRNDMDCVVDGSQLLCIEGECIAPPDPGEIPCATNADCVAQLDQDHVCGPMGGCAALGSVQCPRIEHPDGATPDGVVWIASILPVTGYYAGSFGLMENAVQLAVEDFNDVTSLPGSKKIGWVGCDTQSISGQAELAAEHLVKTGIPAIIGPALSDDLLAIAPATTAAGTFVISPTASAAAITGFEDDDLIWRTIPSDAAQANAIADRLPLLDPVPSRIIILAKRGAYGQGLFEPVKTRVDEFFGDIVASLYYDDPADAESPDDITAAYGITISAAAMHHADTIVILGDGDATDLMEFYLKNAWEDSGDPLPRFVFSHGAVPFMEAPVESVSPGFIATLAANVEGVSPIIQDDQNFGPFDTRYAIRFDENATGYTALAYDATIVAQLAIAAAGSGVVTGAAVADGVALLVDKDGAVISFDAPALQFISDARDAVVDGTGVDLKGTSGELDFDLSTGEVRTDLLGWGVVPSGEGNVTLTPLRLYTLGADPSTEGMWADL